MGTIRWKRKSDGVTFTTPAKGPSDHNGSSVRVTREDNGHAHWATWSGLYRKYEQIESSTQ